MAKVGDNLYSPYADTNADTNPNGHIDTDANANADHYTIGDVNRYPNRNMGADGYADVHTVAYADGSALLSRLHCPYDYLAYWCYYC